MGEGCAPRAAFNRWCGLRPAIVAEHGAIYVPAFPELVCAPSRQSVSLLQHAAAHVPAIPCQVACMRLNAFVGWLPQLTRKLRTDGYPALGLHGDKSQQERDWVLAEFRSGKHAIMIATDVAARGLGEQAPHRSAPTIPLPPLRLGKHPYHSGTGGTMGLRQAWDGFRSLHAARDPVPHWLCNLGAWWGGALAMQRATRQPCAAVQPGKKAKAKHHRQLQRRPHCTLLAIMASSPCRRGAGTRHMVATRSLANEWC